MLLEEIVVLVVGGVILGGLMIAGIIEWSREKKVTAQEIGKITANLGLSTVTEDGWGNPTFLGEMNGCRVEIKNIQLNVKYGRYKTEAEVEYALDKMAMLAIGVSSPDDVIFEAKAERNSPVKTKGVSEELASKLAPPSLQMKLQSLAKDSGFTLTANSSRILLKRDGHQINAAYYRRITNAIFELMENIRSAAG